MKLIITDTNIFFDIISIGALPEFFSLDYEICTTVFVIEEIIKSDQRIEKSKGIKLLESLKEVNSSLPFDEIDKLIRIYKK